MRFARAPYLKAMDGVTFGDRDVDNLSSETDVRHLRATGRDLRDQLAVQRRDGDRLVQPACHPKPVVFVKHDAVD